VNPIGGARRLRQRSVNPDQGRSPWPDRLIPFNPRVAPPMRSSGGPCSQNPDEPVRQLLTLAPEDSWAEEFPPRPSPPRPCRAFTSWGMVVPGAPLPRFYCPSASTAALPLGSRATEGPTVTPAPALPVHPPRLVPKARNVVVLNVGRPAERPSWSLAVLESEAEASAQTDHPHKPSVQRRFHVWACHGRWRVASTSSFEEEHPGNPGVANCSRTQKMHGLVLGTLLVVLRAKFY